MSRLAAVLLLALLAVACGEKGKIKKPAELQKIAAPKVDPRYAWSARAGTGSGAILTTLQLSVQPDAVYSADVEGGVFAFDAVAGRNLWRAETGARLSSGPSVHGALVLVGTLDAEVLALRRSDGNPQWRATLPSEVLAPPTLSGDVVVVRTADGRLFGLSAADGSRLWSVDRSQPALTLRGQSAPLAVGSTVIAGLDNGRLIALDARDGKPLWEQTVSAPNGRTELERITDIDAHLIPGDGVIYVASYGGEVAAVSLETGDVLWRYALKSYSGMALADDRLVISDEDGRVWALDHKSGAVLWKQEGLLNRRVSAPAVQAGSAVVGDFEGYLHWLSLKDGSFVGRSKPFSDPIVAPVVAGGANIFALDVEGRIAVLQSPPKS
ncbi:MAG: outer membrane protein assembly factor BamB [Pseudomonadota bacterium]